MMIGARSERKGYYHPEVDEKYGIFEEKPAKIPKGFKRVTQKRRDRYLADWACKKRKTLKQKKQLANKLRGALEWDKWYNASRKYWLTLDDFKKMKKGDKLVVLPIHQNALDDHKLILKSVTHLGQKNFLNLKKIPELIKEIWRWVLNILINRIINRGV